MILDFLYIRMKWEVKDGLVWLLSINMNGEMGTLIPDFVYNHDEVGSERRAFVWIMLFNMNEEINILILGFI